MKELKITKGEWVKTERPTVNVDGVWMTSVINSNKETVHTVYGETKETADANAQLIAEAGTVANETGLMPREMQEQYNAMREQRNELLKIVKHLGVNLKLYGNRENGKYWFDHAFKTDLEYLKENFDLDMKVTKPTSQG